MELRPGDSFRPWSSILHDRSRILRPGLEESMLSIDSPERWMDRINTSCHGSLLHGVGPGIRGPAIQRIRIASQFQIGRPDGLEDLSSPHDTGEYDMKSSRIVEHKETLMGLGPSLVRLQERISHPITSGITSCTIYHLSVIIMQTNDLTSAEHRPLPAGQHLNLVAEAT